MNHRDAIRFNATLTILCTLFYGIKHLSAQHKIKLLMIRVNSISEHYIAKICLKFVRNSRGDVFLTVATTVIV